MIAAQSLFNAVPALLSVLVLLAFIIYMWGVLGLQLWAGFLHNRCRYGWGLRMMAIPHHALPAHRLTAMPVFVPESELHITQGASLARQFLVTIAVLTRRRRPPAATYLSHSLPASDAGLFWTFGISLYGGADAPTEAYFLTMATNRTLYPWCGTVDSFGNPTGAGPIPLSDASWDVDTSPWATPQSCVWPMNTADERPCSGGYTCAPLNLVTTSPPMTLPTVCGSNYDDFGNPRFTDATFMTSDIYLPDIDYGAMSFDNLWSATVGVLLAVMQSGWSDGLMQLADGYSAALSPIYWCTLIVFGSFFLVNLVLAVLSSEFERTQDRFARAAAQQKLKESQRKATLERRRKLAVLTATVTSPVSVSSPGAGLSRADTMLSVAASSKSMLATPKRGPARQWLSPALRMRLTGNCLEGLNRALDTCVRRLRRVAESPGAAVLRSVFVVINTFVLVRGKNCGAMNEWYNVI